MSDIWSAAAANDKDTVTTLVAQDATNVHAKDSFGMTAVMHAAKAGHADIVQMLLDKGAMPCEKNNQGVTAAHIAGRMGHIDVLKALTSNKFWEDGCRTRDGKTPSEWAQAGSKPEAAEFLKGFE